MATVTYTFVSRSAGGDHVNMDVSVNGGPALQRSYDIDEVRLPLSQLTSDQIDEIIKLLFRVHIAGRTRAQLVTEFQNPVVITV